MIKSLINLIFVAIRTIYKQIENYENTKRIFNNKNLFALYNLIANAQHYLNVNKTKK